MKDNQTKIEDADFSARTYNVLKRAGIDTMELLANIPRGELLKIAFMGKESMAEIERKLFEFYNGGFVVENKGIGGVRHRSSRDEQILRNIFKTICGDCCFPSEYCDRCREKLAIEDACKALEEIRNEN